MADPEEVRSVEDEPTGSEDGGTQVQAAESTGDNAATTVKTTTEASDDSSQSTAEDAAKTAPPASIDLSAISADDILKLFEREDVKERLVQAEPIRRVIQSEKDKEIARRERQLREETKKRAEDERRKKEFAERKRLIEEQDYTTLGEMEARKIQEEEQLSVAASKVADVIEGVVRQHPDFAELGEERIDDIYRAVERKGGNVIDFTLQLANARRQLDVEQATRQSMKTIDDRVKAEVEAALAAAGVQKRSDQVASGEAPSNTITGGGTPKPNTKPLDYKTASKMYGEGDLSWEEFQPFREEHEKRRAR